MLAAVEAARAAKAAKEAEETKAEREARRIPATGKEAGTTNGKVAARVDSAVDGISDMRALRTLMVAALRATRSPLIPLHALIRLMFILSIRLLLLLNLLAITVQYLPVLRMILHAGTVKIKAMNIRLRKNNLNTVLATATIMLPVTAIIVTAR